MKIWMAVPVLLLSALLAAQTNSVTETNLPPADTQTAAPIPAPQAETQSVAPLPAPQAGSVPAGTALMVRLETTLATFSNKAGDPFRCSITQPVIVN